MRVIESALAGVIVAGVSSVIAIRLDTDVVLVTAVSFLVGFAAWAAKGKTTTHYGRRRRRR